MPHRINVFGTLFGGGKHMENGILIQRRTTSERDFALDAR